MTGDRGERDRLAADLVRFADARGLLRFGEFTTKSGRVSPYFFNTGLASDGRSLASLARFYLRAARLAGLGLDSLFGSAYKGIPLVAAIALVAGEDLGAAPRFAFDRKEAKDHGETGRIVGPLDGPVLLVDDVISSGASTLAAAEAVSSAGASPCGALVGLDRGEQAPGGGGRASDAVRRKLGVPVVSVADVADLRGFLAEEGRETEMGLLDRHLGRHGG